jgi:hypothetical protein
MLVVELMSLLGINLVCFILLAFTAKKEDLLLIQARQNGQIYEEKRRFFQSCKEKPQIYNNRSDSSFWNNFHSASDLYRVKALNYDTHNYEGFYTAQSSSQTQSGSQTVKKSKSSGYSSDNTYSSHSKTLLSIASSTDLSYTLKDSCAILQ